MCQVLKSVSPKSTVLQFRVRLLTRAHSFEIRFASRLKLYVVVRQGSDSDGWGLQVPLLRTAVPARLHCSRSQRRA